MYYWLKPLTDEGGLGEVGEVGGRKPEYLLMPIAPSGVVFSRKPEYPEKTRDEFQKMPLTEARKFKP